tara:strand:+ start:25240 stop:25638 length:399 start_codon:yes stop_codon:yes gene_type:complete
MNKKTVTSLHTFFKTSKKILVWDGNCKFCEKCIDWIIAKGGEEKLFLIPFQEIPYPPMSDDFKKKCIKSIQFLKPTHEIFAGGDAITEILFTIGYKKIATMIRKPILRQFIKYLYIFIAKNRSFLSRFIRNK